MTLTPLPYERYRGGLEPYHRRPLSTKGQEWKKKSHQNQDNSVSFSLMTYRLPRWLGGKESTCQQERRFDPWVEKIPWRRAWQPRLARKIAWTEEPGGHPSTGSQTVRHDLWPKQQWHQRLNIKWVVYHILCVSNPGFSDPVILSNLATVWLSLLTFKME